MDNNTGAASHLSNIITSANSFIKAVETGEGFNIPADKMEEYKKQLEAQGANKILADAKAKMEEFKQTINNVNNANHQTKQ